MRVRYLSGCADAVDHRDCQHFCCGDDLRRLCDGDGSELGHCLC